MTRSATRDNYGTLIEPATLKIQRLLPGPIERIWAYLVESDQRRKWLAAGTMELKVGAPFELVWRNDELTDPPGKRPDGFAAEHRMPGHITALDPPRKIAFTFQNDTEVSIELEAQGRDVLLTLIHYRLPNRNFMLGVSGAGTPISTCWWRGCAAKNRRRSGITCRSCARTTTGSCRRERQTSVRVRKDRKSCKNR
jgi:uncharacterized protein YndB with AHSA1/START domain